MDAVGISAGSIVPRKLDRDCFLKPSSESSYIRSKSLSSAADDAGKPVIAALPSEPEATDPERMFPVLIFVKDIITSFDQYYLGARPVDCS